MKYNVVAMDLDGTITQHKSLLEKFNKETLDDLGRRYKLLIVGAGSCERIYEQLNGYPISIIGNYGMQFSEIVSGEFTLIKNDCYTVDKMFFERQITELRQLTGYTEYAGDNVEFHKSGAVTFPLLGTKAKLEDKLSFDPSGAKRMAIYPTVAGRFEDYNCFIGGSSSFDIVKKPYDKFNAIKKYVETKNIALEKVIYIGDDFKKGGNDEQIKLGGMDYLLVNTYSEFRNVLIQGGLLEE